MHGPTLAFSILATSLLGAGGAAPSSSVAQAIAGARQALAANQPTAAIGALERALADPGLAGSPTDKQAILGMLRESYEAAAGQAAGAGRPRDADAYRENARILARKVTGAAPPAAPGPVAAAPTVPSPPAEAGPTIPLADPPADGPMPLPEIELPARPAEVPTEALGPTATPRTESAPLVLAPERLPEIRPGAAPQPAPNVPGQAEADAAFVAKKYLDAGRIYGALAAADRLPADRAEHWAYCRTCVVAQRINARPKTDGEWREIQLETERISQLAPTNYLATYIRNYVADEIAARSKAGSRPGPNPRTSAKTKAKARANSTIVRAASPEEPPVQSGRGGPTATPADPPPATASGAIRIDTPMLTDPAAPPGGPVGRWRVQESANFRIHHANPELAKKVAQVAEAVRHEGIKRWGGKAAAPTWQPRCDIYLFPNAAQYAQMTGQPADSPGFSTMGMNQGQIISRRVSVRTDHEGLLSAVLPHEITHVILADYFTEQQIPRWADEGMAVLMEPTHEQKRRATDLVEPLGRNLLFPIETLMKMDYPDERYWNLYYAQSVSLTRFLVEQGSTNQFIQFLQAAQTNGFEAELKRVYKIDNFNDLQARWVAYARSQLDPETPTATASAEPSRTTRRR